MDGTRLTIIESDELLEIMKSDRTSVTIVDVRDEDFYGGNIVGAINVPSESWRDEAVVNELISKCSSSKKVVFHCMKSQQRGPACASIFVEALRKSESVERPEVRVLRGGYSAWSFKYSGDSSAIENA